MKISKRTIHIVCGIFEAVFLTMAILSIYTVGAQIARAHQLHSFYTIESQCYFALDIMLPLALLCATVIIHVLATISSRKHEKAEAKKQERKQKRIERLQSEIENLRKDGK